MRKSKSTSTNSQFFLKYKHEKYIGSEISFHTVSMKRVVCFIFPSLRRRDISNGHQLCTSPSRHISVLIRSGIHTVFALNWKEKKIRISSTSHTDTSMTYCKSITQTLRIIWIKCTPLSLRSKTRLRATPLLPSSIYSCRSRVPVSCALPFTTNVTISTPISQSFRS